MSVREAHAQAVTSPRADAPRDAMHAALLLDGQAEAAAFVRRQVERAGNRRRSPVWDTELEAAALAESVPAWLDERFGAPVRACPGVSRVGWGRGLPERVTVNAIDLANDGETLRERLPLCELTVRDYAAVGPTFFDLPVLTGLRSLSFAPTEFGLTDLEALAASPMLLRLRVLGLANLDLPASALDLLATAPSLAALRYARLDGNRFTDPNPALQGAPPRTSQLAADHPWRPWFHGFALGYAPPSEAFDGP
ncbi:hypothetical protein LBMAG42_20370 [Deltaproteobacteria bacterium]|nr:hypothetical protein LBMAG42_20370 [Deltaproteobacteria bacterium]